MSDYATVSRQLMDRLEAVAKRYPNDEELGSVIAQAVLWIKADAEEWEAALEREAEDPFGTDEDDLPW